MSFNKSFKRCSYLIVSTSRRRLLRLAKKTGEATTQQEGTIIEQRNILRSRIRAWEQLASVYMPGLLQYQADLASHPPPAPLPASGHPEDAELWLPSRVAADLRVVVCQEGLDVMEEKLRTAQCEDALESIRHILKIKTRMIAFKNRNIHGQKQGTRSRAVIDRVHERARIAAGKYRAAWMAKLRLAGPGEWEKVLRVLNDADITGYQDANRLRPRQPRQGVLEDEALEAVGMDIEMEEGPDTLLFTNIRTRRDGTGKTRHVLSWIWSAKRVGEGDEGEDDILRVEWSKSRARVNRASEEVLRLKEEMRRVLETLHYEEDEWISRKSLQPDIPKDLVEGVGALCIHQASIKRTLAAHFRELWKSPLAVEEESEDPEAIQEPANADDNDEDDEETEYAIGGAPDSASMDQEEEDGDYLA